MSAKHLFGAVSAVLVVSVAACASPTEDAGSAQGAATTSEAFNAQCAEIRDTSDEVAQGELADKYAEADPTGYEACRLALVARAKDLKDGEEFAKWATPSEFEADAAEDPAEAAPIAHDKGTVEVLVHDGMPKGTTSSAPISRVTITGLPGGETLTDAPAATGRPGHRTPHGCFFAFKADKYHHSSTYNGASMPNSVFWYPAIATHTGSVYVASHGCVHLEDKNSLKIYNAYEAGYKVHVCVQ